MVLFLKFLRDGIFLNPDISHIFYIIGIIPFKIKEIPMCSIILFSLCKTLFKLNFIMSNPSLP